MTAVAWFEKGFTDIISVVPPFSQVSENSDLKTKDLGKCPGQPTVSGWAGIPNWLNFETTRADCQFWDSNNSNIGLRSARFPGIDIDVIGFGIWVWRSLAQQPSVTATDPSSC
jgi:hypothetical protein